MAHQFTGGDVVEYNGNRFVVNRFVDSWTVGGMYLYASPATKSGKPDRRYELTRLPVSDLKLISRGSDAGDNRPVPGTDEAVRGGEESVRVLRHGARPTGADGGERAGGGAGRDVGQRQRARKGRVPEKEVTRSHRWGGAGYVCANCGAIKDTRHGDGPCEGAGQTGWDVWLYHVGAGWWIDDTGSSKAEAIGRLKDKLATSNIVAGAVLPAGQPLGLFTKRYGT